MEPLVTRARIERAILNAGKKQCVVKFVNQEGKPRSITFKPSDHFEMRDKDKRNYFVVKSIRDKNEYRTINLDTTLSVRHSNKTKSFRKTAKV